MWAVKFEYNEIWMLDSYPLILKNVKMFKPAWFVKICECTSFHWGCCALNVFFRKAWSGIREQEINSFSRKLCRTFFLSDWSFPNWRASNSPSTGDQLNESIFKRLVSKILFGMIFSLAKKTIWFSTCIYQEEWSKI